MVRIDLHPSAWTGNLQREVAESLRANRLPPKGLYFTVRQAELWRQVSLRHSPVYRNPEFGHIYEEAFSRVTGEGGRRELIGLGCGTGEKEAQLCRLLKAKGGEIYFSAIDISRELVREAAERLVAAGATHRRSLVCDLAQAEALTDWLGKDSAPRLVTFFGLVPNFAPARLGPIFRALLRPDDLLLASVHLAPSEGPDEAGIDAAMRAVLPQYDNPETLAWLAEAIETWELTGLVDTPEMVIGKFEGVPAFLGRAAWKTKAPFEKWGETFLPRPDEPLHLFFSLRHTPESFEGWLGRENLRGERLALTRCREEGIWAIRSS
jgi:L-histidine N-alpha-methyltransferase